MFPSTLISFSLQFFFVNWAPFNNIKWPLTTYGLRDKKFKISSL